MSIIGENIRAIRQQLGLTQDAMAERLGVKRSLLGAYEEGRATPRLEVLNTYSTLSGISIAELVNQPVQPPKGAEEKPRRGRPRKQDAVIGVPMSSPALKGSLSTRNGVRDNDMVQPAAQPEGQAYFTGHEIRLLTVTQASQGSDSFEVVPTALLKEYVAQRTNAGFLAPLSRMSLPFMQPGELYRAFGEGSKGTPGRFLVGRYVRNWVTLSQGDTYLVVTGRDIVHARLDNRLSQDGTLCILSGRSLLDGRAINNQVIAGQLALEIWKLEFVVAPSVPNEPELASRLSRIETYLGI